MTRTPGGGRPGVNRSAGSGVRACERLALVCVTATGVVRALVPVVAANDNPTPVKTPSNPARILFDPNRFALGRGWIQNEPSCGVEPRVLAQDRGIHVRSHGSCAVVLRLKRWLLDSRPRTTRMCPGLRERSRSAGTCPQALTKDQESARAR